MTGGGTGGSGWQTVLADLSLILFMVCAGSLSNAAPIAARREPPPQSLALYRADPDAPPLDQWLREQAADPRQRLTIVATYSGAGRNAAAVEAERLARSAEAAGFTPRVTVEPGASGPARVSLAFENAAQEQPST